MVKRKGKAVACRFSHEKHCGERRIRDHRNDEGGNHSTLRTGETKRQIHNIRGTAPKAKKDLLPIAFSGALNVNCPPEGRRPFADREPSKMKKRDWETHGPTKKRIGTRFRLLSINREKEAGHPWSSGCCCCCSEKRMRRGA